MDYTAAPATALVATHCVLCGRPLVDAPSVECGMGPTCRERALVGAPDAARAEVNALVHRIAAAPDAADVPSLVAQVAAHGYATLAARLTERLAEGRAVTVRAEGDGYAVAAPFSPAFNEALRECAPSRRWDRDAKVWRVPAVAKRGLWNALVRAFPGAPLITDRGVSVVAA
jgi:Family of unknown function (DUF6011)